MSRARQPTDLVVLRGKKHFTKKELEERKSNEVSAPTNRISPPEYLERKQKQEFINIACELLEVGIMSNLDCDVLARYIQSKDKYLKYDKLVTTALEEADKGAYDVIKLEKLEGLRDKALKQCNTIAAALGLTISSRCKLVVPKPKEKEDPNAGMFGDTG